MTSRGGVPCKWDFVSLHVSSEAVITLSCMIIALLLVGSCE